MNMNRSRLDDTLGFIIVAAMALLAFGLEVSVHEGYVLDRGSAQAHADQKQASIRTAAAASTAARANDVRLAMRRP